MLVTIILLSNNSSGIAKIVIGGLSIVIITILISAFRSTKQKVGELLAENRLKSDSNDIKSLKFFAMRAVHQKDWSGAIRYFERIYTLNKDDSDAWVFIPVLFYFINKQESAIPYLKEIVCNTLLVSSSVNPYNCMHNEFLAWAYYFAGHMLSKEGKIEQAERCKKIASYFDKGILKQTLY
jgi:tetratricopeptide (TPR) repeat protein